VASSTKSKEEKPRKRRRADSASLLTWPGMVLVVLGELAVRVSPSWFPWLAPFGLTYGLGWVLLASGVLWRVVSFRWIRAAFPAIVLIATWPSFMLVFSLGLGTADMPEPTVESEASWGVMSFNVRRLDEYSWLERAASSPSGWATATKRCGASKNFRATAKACCGRLGFRGMHLVAAC